MEPTENKEKSKLEKRNEGDLGKHYERYMFALITLKCLFNPNIDQFWIASNLANLSVYDDIVLKITYKNGKSEIFLIQIKTKKGDKPIVAEMFYNKQSDFSLRKYQEGYFKVMNDENIKSLIECSDTCKTFFVYLNNCKVELKKKTDHLEFENLDKGSFREFITSSSFDLSSGYRLKDKTTEFDRDFLNNFYFYPNQLEFENIKENIHQLLTGNKDSTLRDTFILFFYNYFLSGKSVDKTNMMDIKLLLLKSSELIGEFTPPSDIVYATPILLPILKNFTFSVLTESNSERIIWGQILYYLNRHFDINITHKEMLTYWETPLPNEQQEKIKNEALLQNCKNLDIKTLYLFMVVKRLVPFYKKTESSQIKPYMLNLLKNLNIYTIIYNTDQETDINFPSGFSIFKNMGDMSKEIFNESISKIFVSLRNKNKLPISSLIPSDGIGKSISTDKFVCYYNKTLHINNENLIGKEIYINRTLMRYTINERIFTDFFPKLEQNTCMIFNFPENLDFCKLCSSLLSFHSEQHGLKIYSDERFKVCFTYPSPCSFNTLSKIKTLVFKNLYVFQYEYTKNGEHYFTLLSSGDNVENLRKYVTTESVRDDDLIDLHRYSLANIICNNAGMGKSMLLRHLLQIFPPNEYVIYLELSKWAQRIKPLKSFEDFMTFLKSNFVENTLTEFQETYEYIFDWYITKRQLVLLIDDLEELQETAILVILKEATRNGLRLWIVSRPHLKQHYENIFGVFSLELTEFTSKEQELFFIKFFNKHEIKDTSEKLKALKRNADLFETSNIGFCQQTMMLAKIFELDKNAQIESTVDLYDQYINSVLNKTNQQNSQFYYITLCKLALVNVFTENIVKKTIEWSEFTVHIKMLEKDSSRNLLTTFDEDTLPVFNHKTYAEFLTAKWLSKHLNEKTRYDVQTLYEKLYTNQLLTARWFLDTLLVRDLKHIKKTELPPIGYYTYFADTIGRNQLHYMMTYGKTFNIHPNIALEHPEKSLVIHRNDEIFLNMTPTESTKLNSSDQSMNISIKNMPCFPGQCYNICLYLELDEFKETSCSRQEQPLKFVQQCDNDVDRLPDEKYIYKMLFNQRDDLIQKSAVEYAVLAGTLINIEKALQYNIIYRDVDFSNLGNERYFMLYYSVQYGFSRILKKLLMIDNLRSEITRIKDQRTEMSLLHIAIEYEQMECVEVLLDNYPAHMFGEDKEKNTVVHLAAQQADTCILQQILNSSPTIINKKNINGENALHSAVLAQNTKAVEKLAKVKGIELNCANIGSGDSPFSISVLNGFKEIMEILYNNGADINHLNKKGLTPVYLAVTKKDVKVLDLLINWKADLNITNKFKISPLMEAARKGQLIFVKQLIKNGANAQHIDQNGWTALHHAATNKNKPVISFLLKNKLEINVSNNEGDTALMIACKNKLVSIVEHLMDNGANIEDTNNKKLSLLHLAAKSNSTEMIKYLLNLKVDINAKDSNDCTALMLACLKNYVDVVKVLLENNANIQHFSKVWRCTAMDLCKSKQHLECMNIINKELINRREVNKVKTIISSDRIVRT